jgi:hypothetical protein
MTNLDERREALAKEKERAAVIAEFCASANRALLLISDAAGDDKPLQLSLETAEVVYTVATSIGEAVRKLRE